MDSPDRVLPGLPEQHPSPRGPRSDAAVLIPAWNPDSNLSRIVAGLASRGFGAILVVDDGSEANTRTIFAQIVSIPSVHLLRNAVNLGKGRALKTGINFFLAELSLDVLITADADGQHAV